MKIRRLLLFSVLAVVFIGLNSLGSHVVSGETSVLADVVVAADVPQSDTEIMRSLSDGVVWVSSKQICTERMGCTCSHGWRQNDTLRKHSPEDDPSSDQNSWNPHLDIKCPRCKDDWYCPVLKRFLSDKDPGHKSHGHDAAR